MQGGPLMHVIAAKAVALGIAQTEFRARQRQTVANAKAFAEALIAGGIDVLTGGTDVHLVLVDLGPTGLDGKTAENRLEEVGITVNRNAIPFDERPPMNPSGLRIGTPALTTRGLTEDDLREIAGVICVALSDRFEAERDALSERTGALMEQLPALPAAVRDAGLARLTRQYGHAGIGETLREARTTAGVDLDDARADDPHRIRYLDALENEEWDVLPGDAYVRGFLHTYADFLGLDADALVDVYDRQEVPAQAERTADAPFEPPRPVDGGNPTMRRIGWGAIFVAAALAALFIVLGITGGSSEGPKKHHRQHHHAGGKQGSASTTTTPTPAEATVSLTPTGTVWVCLVDQSGKPLVNGETLTTATAAGPSRPRTSSSRSGTARSRSSRTASRCRFRRPEPGRVRPDAEGGEAPLRRRQPDVRIAGGMRLRPTSTECRSGTGRRRCASSPDWRRGRAGPRLDQGRRRLQLARREQGAKARVAARRRPAPSEADRHHRRRVRDESRARDGDLRAAAWDARRPGSRPATGRRARARAARAAARHGRGDPRRARVLELVRRRGLAGRRSRGTRSAHALSDARRAARRPLGCVGLRRRGARARAIRSQRAKFRSPRTSSLRSAAAAPPPGCCAGLRLAGLRSRLSACWSAT